jgi:deoxycytidylate deaminase
MNILTKINSSRDKVSNARISACVVYKNNIVAFGMNSKKTHPFQAKFGRNSESIYLHAETSAIYNALKILTLEELEKSTLYVCRVKMVNNKECWGLSKPCDGCAKAIATFNIKKVYYTLDGEIQSNLKCVS